MSCIATVHRRFALQGSCRASDQLQFRVLGGRLLARQRLTDWRQVRPSSRQTSFKHRAICRGQDCTNFPATSDNSQSKPTKFLHFLRQQAALAAGALFIFMLLVRPITTRWHRAHQPVAEPTPAAVWLPRSATDQEESRKPTQAEHSMPASMYAAMSSGIPATSSRLLRMSDACLMQLTVTLQQVLLANVLVKIGAVFTVALPLVWLGGLLYHCTSGESLQISLFKVYAVLYRAPGAKVTEETTLPAALLMNLIFLCGLFTFAVVLGFVSEEIKSQLRSVKAGNYAVIAQDHTLVLNWNPQLVPLLKQMSLAKTHQIKAVLHDKPVVILAERDKLVMDAELGSILRECKIKVITREGAPHFVKDLAGVSAGQAKTIIVLNPDKAVDAVKSKTATVLAIEAARSRHPSMTYCDQNIVLQTPEEDRCPPIPGENPLIDLLHRQQKGSCRPVRVNGARDITRLMAQTAIQPGVANVYCAVTQHSRNGATFYLENFPTMTGRSYREVRRSFKQGVVCGYVSKSDHSLHLNPGEQQKLEWGDRLIVLANDDSFEPGQGHEPAGEWVGGPHDGMGPECLAEKARSAPPSGSNHKNIVVVGWGDTVDELAAGLAEFAVDGTLVTVISPDRPHGLPQEPLRGCTFRHVEGSPTSFQSFHQAGLAECDSLLLGGLAHMPSKEADAHMLSTLMQVQDFLHTYRTRSKSAHLVTTIAHPETTEVANHLIGQGDNVLTAELVHPEELMSGLLSQVAAEPDLAPLLSELVDNSDGQEIYLRRPERYGLSSSTPTSFAHVSEVTRWQQETAIGYIAGDDGKLHLAPGPDERHIFDEHARVVVIAESD
ncbi:TPA: hypothetical protein ACH3X3_014790 [Trebouxia sp. C0006]